MKYLLYQRFRIPEVATTVQIGRSSFSFLLSAPIARNHRQTKGLILIKLLSMPRVVAKIGS
ncbi:hypothetical protein [Calothrix sp. NIES-3974]|uniref:hypothetical protein n=1 Tax=Calothrix sp. NIES-3974 TaxID=2005462 RepID=UPI0012FDF2FD|nr:hypothetical protein [Calothrix sp. NIES-3974]